MEMKNAADELEKTRKAHPAGLDFILCRPFQSKAFSVVMGIFHVQYGGHWTLCG